MKGQRKYKMHLLASWLNFALAAGVIVAAVILQSSEALMTVIINGMAQGAITGGAMYANGKEHAAKGSAD